MPSMSGENIKSKSARCVEYGPRNVPKPESETASQSALADAVTQRGTGHGSPELVTGEQSVPDTPTGLDPSADVVR
jgi:hypothetical protein